MSPRLARGRDPETSHAAARRANLNGSQRFVLMCLLAHTGAGLAQWELERLAQGAWSPQRVRTAVSELRRRGLAEATGETRPTPYGREAQTYRATDAARCRFAPPGR